MVYLVTWDLNKEKPNYSQARADFIAHLNKFEHVKDSGLDSVWFISTTWSAEEASTYLRQKLDGNDRLVVTKLVAGQYAGWLSKTTWDWIGARL